jgi:hypothetical protein
VNLEQAIHAHWAGSPALEALLPAERLTTGSASGGAAPYVTLRVRAIRPELPTNGGPAAEEASLRIDVWHERYDEARAIVEQLRAAFDGASLAVDDPEGVARVRHVGVAIEQHADGLWQWSVDFTARVCRTS